MGAPVVVTRAPGVDDEINPGVTGEICGDRVSDLSRAILRVLGDPSRAERMGLAAASDIRARLAPDAIFPVLADVCCSAMARAGEGSSPTPSPVRWDQTLLNAGPDGAAQEFASSMGAYAKRLEPARRAMFVDALESRVGSMRQAEQGSATPATSPGSPASRR